MLKSAQEEYQKARPFERVMRQFGEVLKEDEAMFDELKETPDKDSFIDLYLKLAAERGFNFSRDELMVAVQEQKQGKDWIIPIKVQRLVRDRF
jgi:hypothetical protein